MAKEVINPEQDAIDAIIVLLHDLFEYEVYDTKVEMDLEPPCFIVSCYESRMKRRISNLHFFYDMSFQITFFPGDNLMPEIAIREVEFPLIMALERFGEDDYSYRADNIRSNVTGGLLHVNFELQRNIHKEVDLDKIENIEEEIYAKEI